MPAYSSQPGEVGGGSSMQNQKPQGLACVMNLPPETALRRLAERLAPDLGVRARLSVPNDGWRGMWVKPITRC